MRVYGRLYSFHYVLVFLCNRCELKLNLVWKFDIIFKKHYIQKYNTLKFCLQIQLLELLAVLIASKFSFYVENKPSKMWSGTAETFGKNSGYAQPP